MLTGFSVAVALGLGLVFLRSVLPKMIRPAVFREIVRAYRLVPDRAVPLVAALLTLAEAAVALLLIAGWHDEVGSLAALVLVGIFAMAVGQTLRRGRDIACGCFDTRERVTWRTLYRLGLLACVAAGVGALAVAGVATSPRAALHSVSQAVDLLAITAGLLMVGLWLSSAKELVALVKRSALADPAVELSGGSEQ